MGDAQTPPAAPPVMDAGVTKARKLVRRKRLALSFLLVACAAFVVLTVIDPHHHSVFIGLLVAMSEAAMVGGLADWFAVTALFRHPMGQRWIPHTAIIPTNKDQIGKSLADFICDRLLDSDSVLARIRGFNPADRLARNMAEHDSAMKVADFVVKYAPRLVEIIDSKDLQEFVRAAARKKLRNVDISDVLADLLTMLTRDGRHEELLDSLLHDIAVIADAPSTRRMLAEKIGPELWRAVKVLKLEDVVSRKVAEKVASGFRGLVMDVLQDRNHELRISFERKVFTFIDRLRTDHELRGRIDAIWAKLTSNQKLSDYIKDMWNQLIGWLRSDLESPTSSIHKNVLRASVSLGTRLQADTATRDWINAWVLDTLKPLIEDYREKIRMFIIDRVKAWSADELTTQLELNIGGDLQFIRISGTLVGAVVGGLLYGFMHLIRFVAAVWT